MTNIKFVEAIESHKDFITKCKIYEVCREFRSVNNNYYLLKNDEGAEYYYPEEWFKEVEAPTKEETNTFKFIPETEITYVTVNGVKGILIKE